MSECKFTVATDNDLAFTTGGDADWFIVYEPNYYVKDKDSARSGQIGHNQSSWLKLEVIGSGTLTFSYKVSSKNGDKLTFDIDDDERFAEDGTVSRTDVSYVVNTIGQLLLEGLVRSQQ